MFKFHAKVFDWCDKCATMSLAIFEIGNPDSGVFKQAKENGMREEAMEARMDSTRKV